MGWFSKSQTIRCPDGTTRTIYKNIDQACPLFIPGWQTDLGGKVALEGLPAEVRAKYETKIHGLFVGLNEQNQSLMMSFRTVYLAFATNPCANDGFFQREIEKLLDEQRRIAALRVQINGLVQLATANPADSALLARVFGDIAARLGGLGVADAAAIEIAESRLVARQIIQEQP